MVDTRTKTSRPLALPADGRTIAARRRTAHGHAQRQDDQPPAGYEEEEHAI